MSREDISANSGEWSEFYTLIKLICDEEISIVDGYSECIGMEVKKLESVQKDGTGFALEDSDNFTIEINGKKYLANKFDLNIKTVVHKIFECIKSKSDSVECHENDSLTKKPKGAFSLPMAERLAKNIMVSPRKQNSLSKGDIVLKFKSTDTGSPSRSQSASIKSWLGSNPTIFNASKHSTRLIFKVETDKSIEELKEISSSTKREPRIAVTKSFDDLSYKLVFHGYSSGHLRDNLTSYDLQEFVPDIVLAHFSKRFKGASNSVSLEKVLKSKHPAFTHKWKTLLEMCALGMTADSKYLPSSNISDNMIVVNNKGDLCCFFGRNRLQDMLNELAFLDTPSTSKSKHDYGFFYQDNGVIFLDLNFQIRIKSPNFS